MMAAAEIAEGVKIAAVLIKGLQLGIEARGLWDEYEKDLIARQQQRLAEGMALTMSDVRELITKTTGQIIANHAELQRLEAVQAASEADERIRKNAAQAKIDALPG